MIVDRFAPSPTGRLHLGHAYSAWTGWHAARREGGRFLLRMEDLDASRVRPEHYAGIEEDLAWLGLDWDGPVLRQSDRRDAYAEALATLEARRLTYRCTCTRRDIAEAASAPQEGAEPGPDGLVYPGICRDLAHPAGTPHAIRLDMRRAIVALGGSTVVDRLGFEELGSGPSGETGFRHLSSDALIETVGDIVIRRRDEAVAYHLAVVVDDAFQGITRVTRGRDLFPATPIHRLLQALLNLPVPEYCHHRLIRDDSGKRLAKRDDARALSTLRAEGATPQDILAMIGVAD